MAKGTTSGRSGEANRTDRRLPVPVGLRGSRVYGFTGATVVLVTLVFSLYWPAIDAPFVFDDSAAILDNASIRRLTPLIGTTDNPGLLCPPPLNSPLAARPLVNATFALNYHFSGLRPRAYRLVHLVIHALSAILLWRVVVRVLRLPQFHAGWYGVAEAVGWSSAMLWAVHPVNSEAVVYLTQRTELFCGFAALATWYASLRYWEAARRPTRSLWLLIVAVTSTAGMLSKEVMVPAVAIVPLFDLVLRTQSFRRVMAESWPLYAILALSTVPLALLYAAGIQTPGGGFDKGVAATDWWLTQCRVLFLYGRLAIWPSPLQIYYHFPSQSPWTETWPWVAGICLLVVVVLCLLARRRIAGFVGLACLAILSPTSLIPLPGEAAAERRLYLPLALLAPLVVVGGMELVRFLGALTTRDSGRSREKFEGTSNQATFLFAIVFSLVVGGMSWLTAHRAAEYQNEKGLWEQVAGLQPDAPIAYINLGTILAEKEGDLRGAVSYFRKAVETDPASYLGHYNLARSLEALGEEFEAITHYRAAAQSRPNDSASHYNLARLLEVYGDAGDAVRHYQRAIESEPDFASPYGNLAILLFQRGEVDKAIELFETAVRLEPDIPNAMNLVYAYLELNRVPEARQAMLQAKRLADAAGNEELVQNLETAIKALPSDVP